MAHIKKSASTGHLLKTLTGHLTKGCGGSPCATCSAEGTTLRIVLSGLTVCWGSCHVPTGAIYSVDTASIDGTYDFPFDFSTGGSPGGGIFPDTRFCTVYGSVGTSINYWNNGTCSGSPAGTLDFSFVLVLDQTEIRLNMVLSQGSVGPFDVFIGTLSATAPYDCTASHVINNTTACGDFLGLVMFENGTATVTTI